MRRSHAGVGVQAHPGQGRQGCRRRHHLVALHQRGDLSGAEAHPRRLRQQQHRHLRAGVPLADRIRPEARPSAPRPARRISIGSRIADVILVIGANPTDGHPVFASRMKRRLRAGREADRHRSAAHRPGAHAAHRGRLSPAAAARHQCRVLTAMAHVIVTEGLVDEAFVRRTLRSRRVRRTGPRSSPDPSTARRHCEATTGVPAADVRGAARLYATGGNGARSTTAWASPSTARAHRGDGASPTSPWPPATSAAAASG